MTEELCPNCVTPWKCNGPHLIKKNEDCYESEFGNFYKIFHGKNYWEFKPNGKQLNKDQLESLVDSLNYLEKEKMEFENLNETLSQDELDKMIAETIWMADRPRTWYEWFVWTFYGQFKY